MSDEKDFSAGLIGQPIPDVVEQLSHAGHYGASLTVGIEWDAVVIRVGIQTLAHACTYSDWANRWNEDADDYIREFAITDAKQFADSRRQGGKKTGNRPQQEKHLARARKIRRK